MAITFPVYEWPKALTPKILQRQAPPRPPSSGNWVEVHPDFWIPRTLDASRFPSYKMPDPDLPDILDVVKLPFLESRSLPRWTWAAWTAAFERDRPLKIPAEYAYEIAWTKYDKARMNALVPLWRQQMSEWSNQLDDLEDQLTTILWLVEILGKKILPIPPGALNSADQVRRWMDTAQKALDFRITGRGGKAEWRKQAKDAEASKRKARSGIARFAIWLKDNYGRLLEAAQATNTWFDVGIVLGPIMGYVEEGIWGLAQSTLDNYLIAADVLLPGYREDFYRNAQEQQQRVEQGLVDVIEGVMSTQLFGYSLESMLGVGEFVPEEEPALTE